MNEIHHDNESSRVSDEGPRVSTSPIEKLREEQELSIEHIICPPFLLTFLVRVGRYFLAPIEYPFRRTSCLG